jgi:NAD dependent epimerase/dehydratase family
MKVFVAGGSGVLGMPLVRELAARGHEVVATTTKPERAVALETAGGRPVVVDLLDGEAVARAVGEAAPQVVVHQATALAGPLSLRRFDASFALTNRLRSLPGPIGSSRRATRVGRMLATAGPSRPKPIPSTLIRRRPRARRWTPSALSRRPVFGQDRVTRLLLGFARTGDELGLRVRLADVNGQPGAVVFAPDGSPYSVLSLDIVGGVVTTIRSIVNPEKLQHISQRLPALGD